MKPLTRKLRLLRVETDDGVNLYKRMTRNFPEKKNDPLLYDEIEQSSINGSDVSYYAGQLPEVIIRPPKDNAVYKANYMIPNKELRNLFYDSIDYAIPENDYEGAIDSRMYINRLYDLYLKSQKPTIKSTKSFGNIVGLYEKLKNGDPDRANYMPLTNTMRVSPDFTAEEIVAELAHSYLFYGTDAPRKWGWVDKFTSLPGDIKINGKSGYQRPGNIEHTAHSIIEPMFYNYLTNKDVTYGNIRQLMHNMYNNKDFYFKPIERGPYKNTR